MRELGGRAKACAVAISDPAALLRIIEQPDDADRFASQCVCA